MNNIINNGLSKRSYYDHNAAMRLLTVWLLGLALIFFATAAFAKEAPVSTSHAKATNSGRSGSGTGLGIMLGEPTGFSLKSWLSPTTAFDVGVGYSWGDYVEVAADYLWHFPKAFNGAPLVPYLGGGAVLFVDTYPDNRYYYRFGTRFYREDRASLSLGLRVPVGLEFLPRSAPLGVFAEIAPGVGVGGGLFGFVQGALGIRYYL